MEKKRAKSLLLLLLFVSACCSSLFPTSHGFESDELLQDDEEFGLEVGVPQNPNPNPPQPRSTASRKRSSQPDETSDPKSVQFALEHDLGGSEGFAPAGTFTARIKQSSHGGVPTLTKLRFTRNTLTELEKGAFEKLLKDDGFYKIRVPSNVLNSPGKDYVVSSIKARCLPRESLNEHFVIHMDGVNILAVNYGSSGACPYPRPIKYPAKWTFNSYTVLKSSDQAPRTPTFNEEIITGEKGEGELAPPERSFWSKYWMYLIPLVLIVMNAFTQAMNMPEEQAAGRQPGSQTQQQQIPQRVPNGAVRRR